ncbi:MAG: response regulator [Candidatus Omnitrophica bacterium]|nr:response regulator [Candidatus Omnitrophota bacterium]
MTNRILIVDDEPDIRDILKIICEQAGYTTLEAGDGEEALKIISNHPVDLVLLDYKIPKLDGPGVIKCIKRDLLLQHLPIIMVTGKGEIDDRISGMDSGADDYVVKPFDPQELQARIRMALRRTQRDLEANPLTKLPGNISILNELNNRLEAAGKFAVAYLDLDKFKSFNDLYGFEQGDEVIRLTARILIKAVKNCGNRDDFIGHIGGDDFVLISTPDKIDKIAQKVISQFDAASPNFYHEDDRTRGYIIAKNRKNHEEKVPLLSISVAVVTNEPRQISHVAEISQIGAELKQYAKSLAGSNYVKDKRNIEEKGSE